MKPKNKIILSVSLVCALLLVSIPASAALGGLHAKPAAEPEAASTPAVSSLPPAAISAAPSSAPVSQPAMAVSSVPPAAQAAASETGSAAGAGKATARGTQTAKADIKDELTMTIQGKAYRFQYSEQETADNQKTFSGSVAYTSTGLDANIVFDQSGNLVSMVLSSKIGKSEPIMTKEQAISDCKKFIETEKEFAYLKEIVPKLTLDSCTVDEQNQWCEIEMHRYLYGYRTVESVAMTILFDGRVQSVSYDSGNFENVKLPATFDEKPYLAKLATLTDLDTGKIDGRCLYVTSLNHLGILYQIIPGKGAKYAGSTVVYHIALDGSPKQQPMLLCLM